MNCARNELISCSRSNNARAAAPPPVTSADIACGIYSVFYGVAAKALVRWNPFRAAGDKGVAELRGRRRLRRVLQVAREGRAQVRGVVFVGGEQWASRS